MVGIFEEIAGVCYSIREYSEVPARGRTDSTGSGSGSGERYTVAHLVHT